VREQPAADPPAGARGRRAVAALLAALFVLHQDTWLWRDARVVLGLPAGLAYHVAYCLAAAGALLLAVRWAWPREVASDVPRDVPAGGDRDGGGGE
jgi:hypothetical protein